MLSPSLAFFISCAAAKYTALSFFPKGIFEQFRRIANVYFLVISIMMAVGTYVPETWYSSLDPWTTIGPLMVRRQKARVGQYAPSHDHRYGSPVCFCLGCVWLCPSLQIIVGLTLTKEGLEDSKRHQADFNVNHRVALVLNKSSCAFEEVAWDALQPGMVIQIVDRGEFPADIVPIASSEEGGKCYIETANIDGETNLKIRTAALGARCFSDAQSVVAASEGGGVSLSFEPPSASIHSFNATLDTGSVDTGGRGKAALGAAELCLRGAVLRNTKWIIGVVVYTGVETKLVMNSREAPSKLSTVEQMVNQMIYFILGSMVVLTSLTTAGYAVWNASNDSTLWYLCKDPAANGGNSLFVQGCDAGAWGAYPTWTLWPTFFILYNNFLPISLYVTMELVNVAQAYFIDQDLAMYHTEQDTPALARTSNMNGDLGQIEYVFSDKTGTLTCNEMKFRRCTIGARVFGPTIAKTDGPGDGAAELAAIVPLVGAGEYAALHVATLLATCHNVVVEDGKYMAESPDEEALVDGGKTMGLSYEGQTGDQLTVATLFGGAAASRKFTLLATIPFSSSRKRMSVVVRDASGQAWLYCKGADNVMFERTAPGVGFDAHVGGREAIDARLEAFAAEGLRTLVLGHRELSAAECDDWCRAWRDACESTADREGAMAEAAAKMEAGLVLLGTTGIEDRLQDGVPDCIEHIKRAGVKVWVLTGDKMTTAIEIGLSCRLLTPELELVMLEHEPPKGSAGFGVPVTERLAAAHRKHAGLRVATALAASAGGKVGKELGLVVDGPSLTSILGDEQTTATLLELAVCCGAVVACRVSPAQKQLIVKMVKEGLPHKPITLSIGDGANDVPMIQEAQIGVGISGKEGRQAVNSSDFAIAQFRFLEPLLLKHGRWNYRRISKVITYSFYKNIVLTIVLAWWTMDCGFSGQSLYESYVYSGYNFFLGLPILLLGIFDQDVLPGTALKFQKLYSVGLEKQDLNVSVMASAFLQACGDAVLIYYLTTGCFNGKTLAGATGGADAQSNASPPTSVWGGDVQGQGLGLYVFGTAVFTNMVAAMLVKVALLHNSWNKYAFGGLFFSVALYAGFVALYGSFTYREGGGFANTYLASYDFQSTPTKMVEAPGFWLTGFCVATTVAVVDMVLLAVKTQVFTSHTHAARELELVEGASGGGCFGAALGLGNAPTGPDDAFFRAEGVASVIVAKEPGQHTGQL